MKRRKVNKEMYCMSMPAKNCAAQKKCELCPAEKLARRKIEALKR